MQFLGGLNRQYLQGFSKIFKISRKSPFWLDRLRLPAILMGMTDPFLQDTLDDLDASERIEITVPVVFWDDHQGRDLVWYSGDEGEWSFVTKSHHGGYELKRTPKGVTLSLHPADIAELHSDAFHYADGGTRDFGVENFGLCSSARATYRKIEKLYGQDADDETCSTLEGWQRERHALESMTVAELAARGFDVRHGS